MAAEKNGRDGGVQSLQRAFELLEHLADTGGEASLSELATLSGLPMPTIHRLIRTLVDLGYVRQNTNRRYALGARLIRLGENASMQFGSWARPLLAELVDEVGETANLAVLERDEVVYVAQVPSKHSMRMFTEVGRRLLPHGTGVGKAMLAHLPSDDVTALLARTGMPSYTEHTFTDQDALLRELAKIAEQGYALDEAEQELGVRCVAVAVPGAPVPAAVSVSGPSGRLTVEAVERIAPVVQRIANSLGSTLSRDGVTV
ncbi:IclR family transcriptional regulator [Amycolatopsis oliviviridis]|uniref:Glycerol operon regulatory protein n=3 Tax=Amycolatopsis TaxID=1813 RepID=M2QMQ0_9PSEU|nr:MULTISPECIES: IclR family transcriptional regulator [Amycolatopsis]EMD27941.1 Transcriptional regulator, IclR family [Amycolatopsis azurea DSM 43854]OOC03408.1 IclR family transcriptional regulator [Amycolatopsis azurea DSM 43854]OXM47689.1 IclR family transcriptional regulator [Amycolatopsis thailandensis]GHH31544.1 IclR family transcriptional regulator [Amycolatopsis oliviviridis]